MKRVVFVCGIILAAAACQTNQPRPAAPAPASGPQPSVSPSPGGQQPAGLSVVMWLPEDKTFESVNLIKTNITEFTAKVSADGSNCSAEEVDVNKPYENAKKLQYAVSDDCDWEIEVSVGKKDSDDEFVAMYTAKKSVSASALGGQTEYVVTLDFNRSSEGTKVGFKPKTIKVSKGKAGASPSPSTSPGGSAVTYSSQIKSLLDDKCTVCHKPGGSRSSSDLSTAASVQKWKDQVVARVKNGTMPPGSPLGAADKATYQKWADGGYK
jgi:hypothetical protein